MANGSKMKLRYKVLIWAVVILALLITISLLSVFIIFNHYYQKLDFVPLNTTEEIFYSIPDETDEEPITEENKPVTSTSPNTGAPDTGSGSDVTTPVTGLPVTTEPPAVITTAPVTTKEPSKEAEEIKFSKNVINILLIGTDGRTTSERGRSDSMILVSINKDTKQIILTSFLRDIYLYIPTVSTYNRLNASYAYGGTSLLLKTLKRNFGLNIDKYARTNFTSFVKIIDILGGVDVELSREELDNLGLRSTEPGTVHLSGDKALLYCRIRKIDKVTDGGTLLGDFGRTYRQREVLTQLFEKAKSLSVSDINRLLNELLPLVTTNLTQSELMGFATNALTYMKYEVVKNRIPADGTYEYAFIRKMSVVTIDFEKNREIIEKTIKGIK